MRTILLTLFALVSNQAHAQNVNHVDETRLEGKPALQAVASEPKFRDDVCPRGRLGPEDIAQIHSVQPANQAPLRIEGPMVHYGQLSDEDLSQMASVRPSPDAPLRLSGLAGCHRGQLSREDLSYVESVQPSAGTPLRAAISEAGVSAAALR